MKASCIFALSLTECVHPTIAGDTTAERCAVCQHYAGRLRGLGDIVERVTSATGVAALAAAVGCGGCAERRAALNAAVPFTDTAKKD